MPRVRINRIYQQLYQLPQTRYIIAYGGRRSGKSVAVSQLLVRRALENPPRRILVMRKYATTIRLSVWARVQAALDEAIGLSACRTNKTEREIELPSGSSFLFVGADDPQKLKSLEGITDIWLEEANEFIQEDFDTLDAGMSTTVDPRPQIWLSFNPIPVIPGYLHWLQERFLVNAEHRLGELALKGDVAVLRTYYRHNAFCSPQVRRVLEGYRESNPSLYRMWALGEFTKLEGVILDGWDVVAAVPPGINELGYGLDFGFADDPAALVRVWQHNDELWLQELLYATGLTNPELSAAMAERGLEKRRADIVADSAEPKSIAELSNLGWFVQPAEKSPDYKRAAAQYLRGCKVHVLEGSPNLVKELATWAWKRDKQGHVLPVPADGNDHLVDATIYRVYRGAAVPRATFL